MRSAEGSEPHMLLSTEKNALTNFFKRFKSLRRLVHNMRLTGFFLQSMSGKYKYVAYADLL